VRSKFCKPSANKYVSLQFLSLVYRQVGLLARGQFSSYSVKQDAPAQEMPRLRRTPGRVGKDSGKEIFRPAATGSVDAACHDSEVKIRRRISSHDLNITGIWSQIMRDSYYFLLEGNLARPIAEFFSVRMKFGLFRG
jgi:hypothetical protein